MGLAAFLGGHAADHVGPIGDGLLAVEGAGLAGEALADDARVFVDPDLRVTRSSDRRGRGTLSPRHRSCVGRELGFAADTGCGPWPWPRAGARRAAASRRASAASRISWILYSYFPWLLATQGGVAAWSAAWILLRATAGAPRTSTAKNAMNGPREKMGPSGR